jgi:hypothetical protein
MIPLFWNWIWNSLLSVLAHFIISQSNNMVSSWKEIYVCIHLNAEFKIFIYLTIDDFVVINFWSHISYFKSEFFFNVCAWISDIKVVDIELWMYSWKSLCVPSFLFLLRMVFGVLILRFPIRVQLYCSIWLFVWLIRRV